jgi:hypothetical protein
MATTRRLLGVAATTLAAGRPVLPGLTTPGPYTTERARARDMLLVGNENETSSTVRQRA